jgi:hypothetical protein
MSWIPKSYLISRTRRGHTSLAPVWLKGLNPFPLLARLLYRQGVLHGRNATYALRQRTSAVDLGRVDNVTCEDNRAAFGNYIDSSSGDTALLQRLHYFPAKCTIRLTCRRFRHRRTSRRRRSWTGARASFARLRPNIRRRQSHQYHASQLD